MEIPNNLNDILIDKNFTIADCVRRSGLTRPTVKKLVDGEDSYISKMKTLADSIGVSLADIYSGPGTVRQENKSYDNSMMTNIGYQISNVDDKYNDLLKRRIEDLENLVKTKDELLLAKQEIIDFMRSQD